MYKLLLYFDTVCEGNGRECNIFFRSSTLTVWAVLETTNKSLPTFSAHLPANMMFSLSHFVLPISHKQLK